ncbi:MAG: hypothetical protein HQL53_13060, partial [Magnetococcales bacterium]|nr:hypothetical protein [Magnetococcales bacterium]
GIFVLLQAIRSPLHLLHPELSGDSQTLAGLTLIPSIVWIGIWFFWGLFALLYLWRHQGTEPQKI